MFGYIKGTIKIIESNYVIIDNNGIGYLIYVANPFSYEVDKDYTIYTFNFINETENSLYGFKSMEEKALFLKLTSVKGLGPKTALPMLDNWFVMQICLSNSLCNFSLTYT